MSNQTRGTKSSSKKRQGTQQKFQSMSEEEFADLGDGEVAYIKALTRKEAQELFPNIGKLPRGKMLFSLCGADGTPIALADNIVKALLFAQDDELAIASVH